MNHKARTAVRAFEYDDDGVALGWEQVQTVYCNRRKPATVAAFA